MKIIIISLTLCVVSLEKFLFLMLKLLERT